MSNPLIAQFAGEPTLVGTQSVDRFNACLAEAARHPDFAQIQQRESADAGSDFWPQPDDSWGCRVRPYVVQNGVLLIPVKGVLLNNFPYALGQWATGYEYIWQAFKRGCGDFVTGAVKGIAFVCDTPGGMVAGCFDAVDKMVALKEQIGVPVAGFAHEMAYSAGYAIISVADAGSIYVSRTGGVGSIGVVTSHIDASGAYEQMGISITYIASDPSKVEGNSSEAPSADFIARTQARIDELYGIFVAAVARSRGLDEAVIRDDLKAWCFTATQAVSNGLADQIGSLEDATAAFVASLDGQSDADPDNGEEDMTTIAAGTAMQTRIATILDSAEASGRDDLARHFAFKTNLTAEDAISALAAAPKAVAALGGGTPFSRMMDATGNPNVGDGGNWSAGQSDNDAASADPVLAIVRAAGLKGFKSSTERQTSAGRA